MINRNISDKIIYFTRNVLGILMLMARGSILQY